MTLDIAHIEAYLAHRLCRAVKVLELQAKGALYADDIERLRESGCLTKRDLRWAASLAQHLNVIHTVKRDEPSRYRRSTGTRW